MLLIKTFNRRFNFLQLRQVIYACYARTHETNNFCFVTQEDIRRLLQDIFQRRRNHVNSHVAEIISSFTSLKSCQVSPVFAIFTKLFVRQISTTNFWSSWKLINGKIFRISRFLCARLRLRHRFWGYVHKLTVSEKDLHGMPKWLFLFFIKGNFLVKLFIYEDVQWLHHFSSPIPENYV